MATPPNDDTKALFRLLADREWHNYDKIKKALAQTVAPGRALRKYQERVDYSRKYDANSYKVLPSEDEQIELGKVACAQIAITSWKGRGIISRGQGAEKEIKVKPGFRSYGIPGFDTEPEGQDPPPEPPGYTEVPPDDSEPSEADTSTPDGDSGLAGAVNEQLDGLLARIRAQKRPAAEVAEEAAEVEEAEQALRERRAKDDIPTFEVDEIFPDAQSAEAYEWPKGTIMVPSTATPCIACGQLVVDIELHSQWHSELAGGASLPVFSLEDVRSQVDNALAAHLDAFQVGMTNWLVDQFAMLEQAFLSSRAQRPWRQVSTNPISPDLPPNKSE